MAKQNRTGDVHDNVKLIRKSNELVEARYKFDIWEVRVFAKALTLIKPSDVDFKTYNIYIGDLLKDLNLSDKGDNYQSVKDAARRLMKRVIEVERETPEGIKWFETPLIVSVEGFKDPKEGNYISVQFHPNLKPYLLELKARYLVYDIRNLWGLSSVYSVRVYELLKQYEKIGKRKFKIDDLRLILGLTQGEYPLYANFKQKVILKAQKDLETSTDIKFSFDEEKQGKKIDAIIFRISKNVKQNQQIQPEQAPESKQTAEILRGPLFIKTLEQVGEWGITETTLNILLKEHGEENVNDGLICTLESIKHQKIKDNIGGFFIKAVEEGWKSSEQIKQLSVAQKKQKLALQKEQAQQEVVLLENKLQELSLDRSGEANKVIQKLTQADPFLAGEAISKILTIKMVKLSLEQKTGRPLEGLDMDEWRSNKVLRDAVIRQIELMHPADFKHIVKTFDAQIKRVAQQIEELNTAL